MKFGFFLFLFFFSVASHAKLSENEAIQCVNKVSRIQVSLRCLLGTRFTDCEQGFAAVYSPNGHPIDSSKILSLPGEFQVGSLSIRRNLDLSSLNSFDVEGLIGNILTAGVSWLPEILTGALLWRFHKMPLKEKKKLLKKHLPKKSVLKKVIPKMFQNMPVKEVMRSVGYKALAAGWVIWGSMVSWKEICKTVRRDTRLSQWSKANKGWGCYRDSAMLHKESLVTLSKIPPQELRELLLSGTVQGNDSSELCKGLIEPTVRELDRFYRERAAELSCEEEFVQYNGLNFSYKTAENEMTVSRRGKLLRTYNFDKQGHHIFAGQNHRNYAQPHWPIFGTFWSNITKAYLLSPMLKLKSIQCQRSSSKSMASQSF